MQDSQFEFGYDNLYTVEPSSKSGGLALFYMDAFDVLILYFDKRMIDISAIIEGHKVFMAFCLWRSGPENEGTSLGTFN